MAPSYLHGAASNRANIQRERAGGRPEQVKNSAGGYVFALGAMDRLRRFLILGSATGTYYVTQSKLTKENIEGARTALDELGVDAVNEVVNISDAGRAGKNDEAIFVIAMACAHGDDATRARALEAIPSVCRTATHLFMFCEFVQQFRGWGPALRKAVARWYTDKDAGRVAYQAVKYRQRDGWTHKDVLALAHPKPPTADHDAVFRWIVGKADVEAIARSKVGTTEERFGERNVPPATPYALESVEAYERAQASESVEDTVGLILEFEGALPWEALRTDHTKDKAVSAALIPNMPLGALVRQLARLTTNETLTPMSEMAVFVAERLADREAIRRARIHPIALLGALMTYQSGVSARGSGRWRPVREVVDALDAAFYLAFDNVEKTGKRTMLALDVSASMGWPEHEIRGIPGLFPREASAAMSLVQANVGDPYMVTAFSHARTSGYGMRMRGHGTGIEEVSFSPRQRIDDVVKAVAQFAPGGTDCALPMLHAMEHRIEIDTFVVYTDNETHSGTIHPFQALSQYREKTGIDARLVVVGMSSTGFSVADPADPGMLDVVGFDANAPATIAEFSAGRL